MMIQKLKLSQYEDGRGLLIVAEKFGIAAKRAFWIYGAPGQIRGNHAHHRCSQIFIAVQRNAILEIFDGWMTEEVSLSSPTDAIIVPPLHWITIKNFSQSAIILVLCSHEYDETDVITDLQKFQDFVRAGR